MNNKCKRFRDFILNHKDSIKMYMDSRFPKHIEIPTYGCDNHIDIFENEFKNILEFDDIEDLTYNTTASLPSNKRGSIFQTISYKIYSISTKNVFQINRSGGVKCII
jgi:hypothetical protein